MTRHTNWWRCSQCGTIHTWQPDALSCCLPTNATTIAYRRAGIGDPNRVVILIEHWTDR